ncbi:MAG: hypothetical protein WCF09_00315, partial [Gallionella sp.]
NSGYTTVVITAIFNAYFVSVVADNRPWATFAWTAALAVSYAAIMFTAPVIAAYADAYAAKKKLLALTTIGCVAFTALLAFSGPGSLWLTIALIAGFKESNRFDYLCRICEMLNNRFRTSQTIST